MRKFFTPQHVATSIAYTVALVSAATGLGLLFKFAQFPETNIVVAYLLSVVLTARITKGYGYGIAASVLGILAFNYFFTVPIFTFKVNDPSYLITFTFMLITSIITSALTSKMLQVAHDSQAQALETKALFYLTNQLTDAPTIGAMASITTQTVSRIFNCQAGFICYDKDGFPEKTFIQQTSTDEQIHRSLSDIESFRYSIAHVHQSYLEGTEFNDWPVYGSESILGVLRIPRTAGELSEPQTHLVHAIVENTALAMDRWQSARANILAKEEVTQERYRANLLRAISHDLRTPLSGIMGISEQLTLTTSVEDPGHEMAIAIHSEASRLHGLVENILSLTRLQDGHFVLHTNLEAVEEVIEVALAVIARRSEREIAVTIPESLVLIPMDAKLISQVLINLLDNAIKHTADNKCITLSVRTDDSLSIWQVQDEGSGISKSDLPHLFEMFYTKGSDKPDSKRGVGLGLTICESIVKAHGGSIWAESPVESPGLEQGTKITFTLPITSNDLIATVDSAAKPGIH